MDFNKGDVLWIDPSVYRVPELPDGFAFHVQELLGWAEPGRAVWTRGLLIDRRVTPAQSLTLCVPTDQPRAVQATRVPPPAPTLPAAAVSAGGHGRHRYSDDPELVGPPPGYERRVFR
jgi:hypothetical protein